MKSIDPKNPTKINLINYVYAHFEQKTSEYGLNKGDLIVVETDCDGETSFHLARYDGWVANIYAVSNNSAFHQSPRVDGEAYEKATPLLTLDGNKPQSWSLQSEETVRSSSSPTHHYRRRVYSLEGWMAENPDHHKMAEVQAFVQSGGGYVQTDKGKVPATDGDKFLVIHRFNGGVLGYYLTNYNQGNFEILRGTHRLDMEFKTSDNNLNSEVVDSESAKQILNILLGRVSGQVKVGYYLNFKEESDSVKVREFAGQVLDVLYGEPVVS